MATYIVGDERIEKRETLTVVEMIDIRQHKAHIESLKKIIKKNIEEVKALEDELLEITKQVGELKY